VHGLLVGDGPLRPSLERLAGELAAPVHFAGFVNQSALPAYYAAADALVLPSDGRETWGLVVNEGMACGVPAVVSAAAGCAPDLIAEGLTGFTFPAGDVDALAGRMMQIVEGDRTQMQSQVLETIERYSVGAAIDGTIAALGSVLSRVVPGGRTASEVATQ
jgi:glycosyltransferase involved in cell wall biosynthesis